MSLLVCDAGGSRAACMACEQAPNPAHHDERSPLLDARDALAWPTLLVRTDAMTRVACNLCGADDFTVEFPAGRRSETRSSPATAAD
jgi:hypothetical protein